MPLKVTPACATVGSEISTVATTEVTARRMSFHIGAPPFTEFLWDNQDSEPWRRLAGGVRLSQSTGRALRPACAMVGSETNTADTTKATVKRMILRIMLLLSLQF